ncbi:terpene cyclase/mutase family protein [candidate division KSB1 bacterium]|nr:terpene cyclase/mutase family protein [candidate division KSB1 bacterium]
MNRVPLLLANPSLCFRLRVLRDLLKRPADDPEVLEFEKMRLNDPLVTGILNKQADDGSWKATDFQRSVSGNPVRVTAFMLVRLAFLGFSAELAEIKNAAEFIFSRQQPDGSWQFAGDEEDSEESGVSPGSKYSMIPLQTALPLRGLAACGLGTDPRAERAYEWLLAKRLEDGAFPAGIAGGNYGYIAGYRKMPHSRWGCRSNTTGALFCLAYHENRRSGLAARRALDMLLARETFEKHTLGFEASRMIGCEPARGTFTFYAKYDVSAILDLCGRIGASRDDPRVVQLIQFVSDMQGKYGMWEYIQKPQASPWVTFFLLHSLSRIAPESDWLSFEPRTPFQGYPGALRRY